MLLYMSYCILLKKIIMNILESWWNSIVQSGNNITVLWIKSLTIIKCVKNLEKSRFFYWEQRKYKDIGVPLSGGNLSYDSLDDDGDKKCVLYGDLYTKYDCIIQDIKNRTFEVGNSIVKNDILFPQSTTVDAYSLISPACLNEEKAETSGVFVIRPYKDINGNFICYYTKGNIEQRKKLSKKAQGLTIVHLYYHSIKDENIMVPNKDEQDKIASVLLNIDNLITLHQRKLEFVFIE